MLPAGSGPRPAPNGGFLPLPEFNVLDQPADEVDDRRDDWMEFVYRGMLPRDATAPVLAQCRVSRPSCGGGSATSGSSL